MRTRDGNALALAPVRLAAWLLPWLFAALANAAPSDALAELEGRLQRMASFSANFEQTVYGPFGEALQTTRGRLYLQRPGRLRWEVAAPYPQLVLADGESLWVHDPDLAQVTVRPLAEAAGTPGALLTGVAPQLGSAFSVQPLPEEEGEAAGLARYLMRPLAEDAVLQTATLGFATEDVLRRVDLVDHLQQTTRIVFTAAELNPVLDSALFQFEVPPGADVIGHVPVSQPEQLGEPSSD